MIASSSCVASNPFVTIALGASVVWDGRSWTIVNLGATQTTLLAVDGTLINLPQTTFEGLIKSGQLPILRAQDRGNTPCQFMNCWPKPAQPILKKPTGDMRSLLPFGWDRSDNDENIPARTIRDWFSKWRESRGQYGCGYVGLLSHHQEKGNRQQKIPNITLEMMKYSSPRL